MRVFSDGGATQTIEEMMVRLQEPPVQIELDEGQRQATLLALAKLSLQRPGLVWMLNNIALKMDNESDGKAVMFESFRRLHRDTEPTGL